MKLELGLNSDFTGRLVRFAGIVGIGLGLIAGASAAAQQTMHAQAQNYVSRYDVFAGFTDIDSPALGLNQKGFHTQAGVILRRWLSMGGDYSVASGHETLTTGLLNATLQARVAGAQAGFIKAGLLPPNYVLMVPTDAFTQTFAFGPQLTFRHFSKATFFLRPSLGALREHAVPKSTDPFESVIVKGLAPAGFKTDWTGFYGAGGGVDFALSKHLGVRAQMDAVYNHPFDDLLASGRMTYRYSVGPSFHFGRDVGK